MFPETNKLEAIYCFLYSNLEERRHEVVDAIQPD